MKVQDQSMVQLKNALEWLDLLKGNDHSSKVNQIKNVLKQLETENTELKNKVRELQQNKKDLEETKGRYEDLYQKTPIGFVTFDDDFNILDINQAALSLLKASRKQIGSKKLLDFVPIEFRQKFKDQIFALKTLNDVYKSELRIIDSEENNIDVFIDISMTPSDEEGKTYRAAIQNVTDRINTESSLKLTTSKYNRIAENQSLLLLEVDESGTLCYANSSFLNLFNINSEEFGNLSVSDFIFSKDQKIFFGKLDNLFHKGEGINFIFRFGQNEKEIRYIECSADEAFEINKVNTALIVAYDVTDRLNIEKELRWNEQIYKTLTHNLPGMDVYVYNKDMEYILVAGNEHEKHGLNLSEYIGLSVNEAYNRKTRKLFLPLYESAIEGKFKSREIRIDRDNYFVDAIPLKNTDGEVYAGMILLQNITEEKLVEEDLRKAKEEAESANRAKSEFLANISHEIRTPLNAIIGFSEQLDKTELSENQQKFNDLILSSSNHLLSIVNEILILFKIEVGKVVIEKAPFDVRKVFEEVHELFKIRADKKNVEFIHYVEERVPKVLIGDALRLKQILINLVSNAIKFTNFGSVSLIGSVKEDLEDKIRLSLKVKDTGIGIAENELPNIFKEFSQEDASLTRKFGGSGLGLSICKKLVDLYGGEISVNSIKNIGTEFEIELVLAKGNDNDINNSHEMDYVDIKLIEGTKVLLVDDDETNRFLGETILKSWNVVFDLAEDGEVAIKKLNKNTYDLILLDIHMPKVSGIDVTKYLRSQRNNPNHDIKIIAVTANVIKSDVEKYLSSGMQDYVLKPFREQELFNKICNILGISANEQVNAEEKNNNQPDLHFDAHGKKYDLNDLLKVSKGDAGFFNKMIYSFMQNVSTGMDKMLMYRDSNEWKRLGETAHKMISSFRFFGINHIVDKLKKIEDKTLKSKGDINVSEMIDHLQTEVSDLIHNLEEEIIEN
jgi:PAS domain S-box-containing protein